MELVRAMHGVHDLGTEEKQNRNAVPSIPSFSGISSAMFVLWGIKSAELHKTVLFPNVFPNVACEICQGDI